MRKALILASAAIAAWASFASAQTPAPVPSSAPPSSAPKSSAPARSSRPQNQCFDARFVSSFSAPDNETVYVRVGVRDVYKLKLFAPCLDVDWRMSIALKSRSGSDWICQGYDAELIVPSPGMGRQRCPVSDVMKLTPEEVAALPKRDRP
jgi:hypothetical protein